MTEIGKDRLGRVYHIWADARGRVRLLVEDGVDPMHRVYELDRSAGEIGIVTDHLKEMLISDFEPVVP